MSLTASTPLLAPLITVVPISLIVVQAFNVSTSKTAPHILKKIFDFIIFYPNLAMWKFGLAILEARF